MSASPSSAYVAAIRATLHELPGGPLRLRPADRRLALDLHRRSVPLDVLRSAIFLATLRRLSRNPGLPSLAPVRSLSYFLPVLDELLAQPLDPAWGDHLARRLAAHLARREPHPHHFLPAARESRP